MCDEYTLPPPPSPLRPDPLDEPELPLRDASDAESESEALPVAQPIVPPASQEHIAVVTFLLRGLKQARQVDRLLLELPPPGYYKSIVEQAADDEQQFIFYVSEVCRQYECIPWDEVADGLCQEYAGVLLFVVFRTHTGELLHEILDQLVDIIGHDATLLFQAIKGDLYAVLEGVIMFDEFEAAAAHHTLCVLECMFMQCCSADEVALLLFADLAPSAPLQVPGQQFEDDEALGDFIANRGGDAASSVVQLVNRAFEPSGSAEVRAHTVMLLGVIAEKSHCMLAENIMSLLSPPEPHSDRGQDSTDGILSTALACQFNILHVNDSVSRDWALQLLQDSQESAHHDPLINATAGFSLARMLIGAPTPAPLQPEAAEHYACMLGRVLELDDSCSKTGWKKGLLQRFHGATADQVVPVLFGSLLELCYDADPGGIGNHVGEDSEIELDVSDFSDSDGLGNEQGQCNRPPQPPPALGLLKQLLEMPAVVNSWQLQETLVQIYSRQNIELAAVSRLLARFGGKAAEPAG
jgi:hypothetical protein